MNRYRISFEIYNDLFWLAVEAWFSSTRDADDALATLYGMRTVRAIQVTGGQQ